jgi:hypothetical protein
MPDWAKNDAKPLRLDRIIDLLSGCYAGFEGAKVGVGGLKPDCSRNHREASNLVDWLNGLGGGSILPVRSPQAVSSTPASAGGPATPLIMSGAVDALCPMNNRTGCDGLIAAPRAR